MAGGCEMNQCSPEHINKYCYIPDNNDNVFQELVRKLGSDYLFVFKVKCTCENDGFFVYKDKHPTVELDCPVCNENISVYDLKYYPCAVKLNEDYVLDKVSNDLYCVYVAFEYSNEFEEEDDVEFDINDISWCYVYVKNITTNELIELVNDETA